MSIPIIPYDPVQYNIPYNQASVVIPFPFFENGDITIYRRNVTAAANDAVDILVLNTDYTLTGAGSQNGGVATFVTLPVGTQNQIITPIRTMTEERMNLYIEGGLFTADQVNDDFSRDVMMNQQNQYNVLSKTPHYQQSAIVAAKDKALPLLGASQVWGMNAGNTAIVATDLPAEGTVTLPVTNEHVAIFDGTTGALKNSLVSISGTNLTGVTAFLFNNNGFFALKSTSDAFATILSRSATTQDQDLFFTLPSVYFAESGLSMVSNNQSLPDGHTQYTYATIPGRNRLLNGSFLVWEEGTGEAFGDTDNGNYLAQMWQTNISPSPSVLIMSVIRTNGPTSGSFFLKLKRSTGATSTDAMQLLQTLTRDQSLGLAGNNLSLRFKARKGTGFSSAGSLLRYSIVYGTGTTDVSYLSGFTGSTVLDFGTVTLATTTTDYLIPIDDVPPANATQFAVIFQYSGAGTAGANDYFEITDVQFERSPFPTPYEYKSFAETLWDTSFFYCKSFDYEISPSDGVAILDSFPVAFNAPLSGAVSYDLPSIYFPRRMRTSDENNIALYAPVVAGAQARDLTANVSCTATVIGGCSDSFFSISPTGNAATVAGNILTIHYTKDDRLY